MADTQTEPKDQAAGRGLRSPGYPACPIETAIEKVRTLKDYMPSRKPVPIDSAVKALGYSVGSGAGMQMIASLKKFGLVEDSGSLDQRTVRVSDLAWKIIGDIRPQSAEREKAIAEAALSPKIHGEIRERWPHGLPDDAHIGHWLRMEKAFNEKSVPGFLKDLRCTWEYAKLDSEAGTTDNPLPNAEIKVGSFVQWTSMGMAMFPVPRQVTQIAEKDGEKYVSVKGDDGQEGWVPMSQCTLVPGAEKATGLTPPEGFAPPFIGQKPPETGTEESRWKLPSGNATLRYPANLTESDFRVLQRQISLLKFSITGVDDEEKS